MDYRIRGLMDQVHLPTRTLPPPRKAMADRMADGSGRRGSSGQEGEFDAAGAEGGGVDVFFDMGERERLKAEVKAGGISAVAWFRLYRGCAGSEIGAPMERVYESIDSSRNLT